MLAGFGHFHQLPIADKIRLVEEMWDVIADSNEPFPVPDWMKVEAERRWKELEADPSRAITRDELWRRVDEARG
jgi:putative addiction module component (TIGR02574 family)